MNNYGEDSHTCESSFVISAFCIIIYYFCIFTIDYSIKIVYNNRSRTSRGVSGALYLQSATAGAKSLLRAFLV